jgi:DNA-binding GntR family transcriptional regulator
MTMQLFESEKLKRAADISYALAAEITDLLKLREALQTARRSQGAQRAKPQDAAWARKKLNRIKANSAPGRLFMQARW